MPGAVFLEGDSINLRTVEEGDLERIRDIYNHPEVRRFITNDRPANLEQERDLVARVIESNEASQQVWEKLGFTQEGELREEIFRNGEYENAYIYGLLKEEWGG